MKPEGLDKETCRMVLRAAYEEVLGQLFPADERTGNYVDAGPRAEELREVVRAYVRFLERADEAD